MISQREFREQIRAALANLYDQERLRRLPLGQWIGTAPGRPGQGNLQRVLLEAIEALKPPASTPVATPAWRTYHILFYRFVRGASPTQVADQLGFGERHFYRHQARAVRALYHVG